LTAAGFIGDDRQWAEGGRRWRRALAKAGIEHFDMADFEDKTGPPWSEWTDQKRRAALNRLVTLTASTVLMGAGAIVAMDDYDGLEEDVRQTIGSPCLLALCTCVGLFARWCEQVQGTSEKVRYVFEGNGLGIPQYEEALARLIVESDDFKNGMRVQSFTVARKEHVPFLQMADILTWEVTRHVPRWRGLDRTLTRHSMDRLLEAVPLNAEYFDAQALRDAGSQRTPERFKRAPELCGMSMRTGPSSTNA
jgi:hypothetical protein